ncbi:Rap1a/Tai family immunity protein [Enterobacter hormaechei]|uniref:Rap1a/Tai family immunity protein n=2 Tax=Enterobacter hormaechei TaxID=158836 RepID=UPI0035269098
MIKQLTFFLAISISSPSFSQPDISDGEYFLSLMDSYQTALSSQATDSDRVNGALYLGYIAGISDALTEKDFCIPEGVTLGSMAKLTSKYVSDHPWIAGRHGGFIIIQALKQKYPCH